jgi:choline dehydrogenase-like flavoprotein
MSPSTSYDVVIVGGGAAGCAFAGTLTRKSDRSILLLEAGPDFRQQMPASLGDGWRLPDVPDWGYIPDPDTAGTTTRVRRGRLLGGTSWLTRFAVRGSAADFDAWAARGNAGWAFGDVLPVFRRIEADAEFGDRDWHGDAGPIPITRYPGLAASPIHAAAQAAFAALGFPAIEDHNAPDSVGVGPMPFSTQQGIRVTGLDAFLSDAVAGARLTIRVEAMVATVILDRGRAAGVRLIDGTEIRADRVVLAAGVYGSPTILLRSGIGPALHLEDIGIEVEVDLPGVGDNLADHPSVSVDTGWRGDVKPAHVLHTFATFRSSGRPADAAPDLAIWVADPDGADAGFSFDVLLMKPESRGVVRLMSSHPSIPPQIRLPGRLDPTDVARLAEGYRMALDLANRAEIRKVVGGKGPADPGSEAALRAGIPAMYYSIPHTVGTCRMGPSPADGDVVDNLSRVHGVEGLSVIDASIIPEATAGFPHLVTLMLANSLAETLGTDH